MILHAPQGTMRRGGRFSIIYPLLMRMLRGGILVLPRPVRAVFCGALLLALAHEGLAQKAEAPPAVVSVAEAARKEVRRIHTFSGTVEPRARSVVAAEIEGKVERRLAEEGDFVKKGQPLLQLDDSTTRLKLAYGESALAETSALCQKAEDDFLRARDLHAKGFLSDEGLQAKETDRTVECERKRQWEIQVFGLRSDMEKYRVRAPFAGLVAKTHLQAGEWVKAGEAVAELLDIEAVHLTVDAPEHHIAGIRPGQEVAVRADAADRHLFRGRVIAVVPQARERARTFPVKVEIPNAGHALRSGMFARAEFAIGDPYEALLVPKDALVARGGGYVVFVVEDGAARMVLVRMGEAFGEWVAVEGDIAPGAQVVTRGNERLFPGQKVQVLAGK